MTLIKTSTPSASEDLARVFFTSETRDLRDIQLVGAYGITIFDLQHEFDGALVADLRHGAVSGDIPAMLEGKVVHLAYCTPTWILNQVINDNAPYRNSLEMDELSRLLEAVTAQLPGEDCVIVVIHPNGYLQWNPFTFISEKY